MEADYGWPVLHREGWPDLVGSENDIYRAIEIFNARSRAIKAVFLNQFGFGPDLCGRRMPEGMTLRDLRIASDAEFGLSIYEPFGIAQLETLPYGGIPIVNAICGCAELLASHIDPRDHVTVDFTEVPLNRRSLLRTKEDFKELSQEMRDIIETDLCRMAAEEIAGALPQDDAARRTRLERVQQHAVELGWERIAENVCAPLARPVTPSTS